MHVEGVRKEGRKGGREEGREGGRKKGREEESLMKEVDEGS
jgi:hypothetical protein